MGPVTPHFGAARAALGATGIHVNPGTSRAASAAIEPQWLPLACREATGRTENERGDNPPGHHLRGPGRRGDPLAAGPAAGASAPGAAHPGVQAR